VRLDLTVGCVNNDAKRVVCDCNLNTFKATNTHRYIGRRSFFDNDLSVNRSLVKTADRGDGDFKSTGRDPFNAVNTIAVRRYGLVERNVDTCDSYGRAGNDATRTIFDRSFERAERRLTKSDC